MVCLGASVTPVGGDDATGVSDEGMIILAQQEEQQRLKAMRLMGDDDDDDEFEGVVGGGLTVDIATMGKHSGDTTKVIAALSAEVVEIEPSNNSDANDGDAKGFGSLEVHLDCIPTVTQTYGRIFSGGATARSGGASAARRGEMAFLSHLTMSLSRLFGAKVNLTGSALDGGIEADFVVGDEEGEVDDDTEDHPSKNSNDVAEDGFGNQPKSCKKLFSDLYIGSNFAYALHVDVHIIQSGAGNLLTAASLAINAAIRTMKLPHVSIITAANGTPSVEVEPRKIRGGPGVAPIRFTDIPICVTTSLHEGLYTVDPTLIEEQAMPSMAFIGVTEDKTISYFHQFAHSSRRPFTESSTICSGRDFVALAQDALELGGDLLDSLARQTRVRQQIVATSTNVKKK